MNGENRSPTGALTSQSTDVRQDPQLCDLDRNVAHFALENAVSAARSAGPYVHQERVANINHPGCDTDIDGGVSLQMSSMASNVTTDIDPDDLEDWLRLTGFHDKAGRDRLLSKYRASKYRLSHLGGLEYNSTVMGPSDDKIIMESIAQTSRQTLAEQGTTAGVAVCPKCQTILPGTSKQDVHAHSVACKLNKDQNKDLRFQAMTVNEARAAPDLYDPGKLFLGLFPDLYPPEESWKKGPTKSLSKAKKRDKAQASARKSRRRKLKFSLPIRPVTSSDGPARYPLRSIQGQT